MVSQRHGNARGEICSPFGDLNETEWEAVPSDQFFRSVYTAVTPVRPDGVWLAVMFEPETQ